MSARYRTQRWFATDGHNVRSMEPDGSTRAIADVIYGNDLVRAANARMIAAAPDLLAATKAMLVLFEREYLYLAHRGTAEGEVIAEARAAIAKAETRS